MTGQESENEIPVPKPEEAADHLGALPAANLLHAPPVTRPLHNMAAFHIEDEANEATMRVPKLRTFDPEDAEGWFCQNEAIMILAGVKAQNTKWACVVASLEDKGTRLIAKKFLNTPVAGSQYADLKKCLIKHHVDKDPDWWKKFRNWKVGQRSPLESISELVSLGPRDHTERLCWIYKQMTLERVPVTMRDHLMAESWTDPDSPDQLGDKAESLSKQLKCADPAVAAVVESTDPKSVEAVKTKPRTAEKDKKQTGTKRKRSDFDEDMGLCMFHKKYGTKAYSCRMPDKCALASKTSPRPASSE